MPELPEVETTRRGVEPHLVGQAPTKIQVRNGSLRWPVSPEVEDLVDYKLLSVTRRAKYILFNFEHGTLLVHLGMSGSLRIVSPNEPLKKHDHVVLEWTGNLSLRFNDPRRFGCVLWAGESWADHGLIKNLGPEPLEGEFNADYLFDKSRSRKTSIKQFVMDGNVVVGVGNIYANEALFMSGISPKRLAGNVSKAKMVLLVENIRFVLQRSIDQGGTTLRDFLKADGSPGYFKQQLNVYGRKGLPCVSCGHELKEIRQNNRSTVYCSKCQR